MKKYVVNNCLYKGLRAAAEAINASPDAVRSYARDKGVSLQEAILVYANNGGNFKTPAKAWTSADLTTLQSLAGKKSVKDIAQILGRSEKSVAKKATEIGISLRVVQSNALSAQDISWILANHGKLTQEQMAATLNCTIGTIQYHLRKNGLVKSRSKVARAVRANAGKMPAGSIALMANCAIKTVSTNAVMERKSLAYYHQRWTQKEETFLRTNYPQMNVNALAKSLGKAPNTVRTHLKSMGIYCGG